MGFGVGLGVGFGVGLGVGFGVGLGVASVLHRAEEAGAGIGVSGKIGGS